MHLSFKICLPQSQRIVHTAHRHIHNSVELYTELNNIGLTGTLSNAFLLNNGEIFTHLMNTCRCNAMQNKHHAEY